MNKVIFVSAVALSLAAGVMQPPVVAADRASSQPAGIHADNRLTPVDAFLDSSARRRLSPRQEAALTAAALPGTRVQMEKRLGVPTVLWAADPGTPFLVRGATVLPRSAVVRAARAHARRLAGLYRLSRRDIGSAKVSFVHDTGRGGVIVRLRQTVDGVDVFGEAMNIAMNRDLTLIGITGYLSPARVLPGPAVALSARGATGVVTQDVLGRQLSSARVRPARSVAGFDVFRLPNGSVHAKRVLYRTVKGLRPAYQVEVSVAPSARARTVDEGYIVAADDGTVLRRWSLSSKEKKPAPFTYRVWADQKAPHQPQDGPQGTGGTPHPTGVPDGYQAPFVPPSLVSLVSGPIKSRDPWLPANATVTTGNNVDAYSDVSAPDGFTPASGDVRATTTSPGTFDRTYDTTLPPNANANQTQAAITQVFYTTNYLHDMFYDAGFDEASGNAQQDNYGRGGAGGDPLHAEAQDFSGTNNANMFTPSDGFSPRMQMYLWTGPTNFSLTANSPASIAGPMPAALAQFGPTNFDTTGDVTLVDDGSGVTSDGCQSPFANAAAVAGHIALVDRGTCGFVVKAANAQANGAIGVLVANNVPGPPPGLGGVDPAVTTPTFGISQDDGVRIKNALTTDPVNMTMHRFTGVNRDGDVDNTIIAHEWGHYISTRLVAGGGGLGTKMARGLGEGWGDFTAMLLTVRPEDAATNYAGTYGMAAYSVAGLTPDNFYFGIRRVPYSTDMTKNALTFKHISNGVPLPPVPTHDNGIENAEVHNTGEIWATMLWEAYASLLRDKRYDFKEARARMIDDLVAGYMLTPANPTLLEARDALLMAAYGADHKDHLLFMKAFAKRGAGVGAVAPDRNNVNNSPVVESYDATGGQLQFTSVVQKDVSKRCVPDDFLDNGETAHLLVTVRNLGARRLTHTTATVTSNTPGLTVTKPTVNLQDSDPTRTATGVIEVKLAGVTGKQLLDLTISVSDPDAVGAVSGRYLEYGNADIVANASASDDVESPQSAWTQQVDLGPAAASWTRQADQATFDHFWHGPDFGSTSDTSLVSPPLSVGADPLVISYSRRFAFEQPNFDGGVIEVSTDNGTTWNDVGAAAAGYNGTIDPDPAGDNPLRGRSAFVNNSPGYPAYQPASLNLGTTYAGQTVRIRFRAGSDVNASAQGWDIDDISVSGLTSTPFTALVADPGC